MTDQETLEYVLKNCPYPLYQVVRLLKQDDPDLIKDAQIYFAKGIKNLYLDTEQDIPEDPDRIIADIINHEDENETEVNEIKRLLLRSRHEAYVQEHGLEFVLDAIKSHTIDPEMSRDLDYEFVFFHHYHLGLDFPTGPEYTEVIATMFRDWLVSEASMIEEIWGID